MKRRATATISLVLACLAAGVLAASVLADTPPPPPPTTAPTDTTTTATTTAPAAVIADGVIVGGVAVGGLAPDLAVQAVLASFERPVVLRLEKTKISVTPDLLGTTVPADSAVAKALTVAPNTTLGLRAAVNKLLVQAFVKRIAARFDRKPVDSRLLFRNFKPVVTPSVTGRRVNVAATVSLVVDQLTRGTRATITLPAKILEPKVAEVRSSSSAARRICSRSTTA
jgi:vancomycin resistance protein YoaR